MEYMSTKEVMKLINPNSSRYSQILNVMFTHTDKGYDFVFEKLPKDMNEQERIKLLKWFNVFGNKLYRYSLSEESIIAKRIEE